MQRKAALPAFVLTSHRIIGDRSAEYPLRFYFQEKSFGFIPTSSKVPHASTPPPRAPSARPCLRRMRQRAALRLPLHTGKDCDHAEWLCRSAAGSARLRIVRRRGGKSHRGLSVRLRRRPWSGFGYGVRLLGFDVLRAPCGGAVGKQHALGRISPLRRERAWQLVQHLRSARACLSGRGRPEIRHRLERGDRERSALDHANTARHGVRHPASTGAVRFVTCAETDACPEALLIRLHAP